MALDYNLTYVAPPTCADFLSSRAPRKIIAGPVGSGKSSACVMHMVLNAIEQAPDDDGIRRTRFVVCRNTIPALRQTTIKTFLDWIPDGVFGQWVSSDKVYRMKFDDVESEVLFMSMEDASDLRKLLSLEATGFFINEAKEIQQDVIEGIIGTKRIGRYPSRKQGPGATYPFFIMDTNFPAYDSYHQKIMDGEEGDWETFKQPGGRTPEAENLAFLPPDYYNTEGLSEDYIRSMIDCEYSTSREGLPVFRSTFIPDFHISKEALKPTGYEGNTILIGMDAGLTPAAVIGQQTARGTVNILGECYVLPADSMGMERFLDTRLLPLLRSKFAGCAPTVIIDPAAMQRSQASEETVFEILGKKRLKAICAPTNKTELRIGSAESLFSRQTDGKAGLLIDAACPWLISALKHGYKYAAKRDGEIEEKPAKNNYSHVADAFCYLTSYLAGESRGFGRGEARKVIPAPYKVW